MVLAGLLLNGVEAPDDRVSIYFNPTKGEGALIVPLGGTRFRCYSGYYQQEGRRRLSGQRDIGDFLSACVSAGAPEGWFARAEATGPLASFDCADHWVENPYWEGVVLVGDAAASSDPMYGCGLSLALRDVRVLRDRLVSEKDWETAAKAYASEHDRYYGSIHQITDWMTKLMYEPGPAAARRRERAFARIAEDQRRLPDLSGLGPESPSDEAAYRNLFGDG